MHPFSYRFRHCEKIGDAAMYMMSVFLTLDAFSLYVLWSDFGVKYDLDLFLWNSLHHCHERTLTGTTNDKNKLPEWTSVKVHFCNVFSMCGSKIYRLYPFESQKSLHGNWHLQPSVQKQSQSNSDLNLQLIHIKLVWSHLYLKVQSVYAPLMFRVNDGPYFFL